MGQYTENNHSFYLSFMFPYPLKHSKRSSKATKTETENSNSALIYDKTRYTAIYQVSMEPFVVFDINKTYKQRLEGFIVCGNL